MACDTKNDISLNYYLTVNWNNICRICLGKSSKLMPIFDPVKPPHFSLLIMACASVQVVDDDGLPQLICQKCISRLNLAFQFKTQCESIDAKLRECFEHIHQMQTATCDDIATCPNDILIFEETTPNNAILPDIRTLNNPFQCLVESDPLTQPQEVVDNKEFVQLSSGLPTPTESFAELPKLEQLQNVPLDLDSVAQLPFIPVSDEQQPTAINDNKRTIKARQDHKCPICNKVFRLKPSLVHHIRIHTGERPYICRICSKSFVNAGHLHTHMKTHTGEKNHACSACPKAFATSQQLTKHTIAIHTSQRPYCCKFCPKRFANSSNLSTHIKIHTGEKNYFCDQCFKAFQTKTQVYQHMHTHTGEKAFGCDHCEKRFTQKAHLTRHLKMHQKVS